LALVFEQEIAAAFAAAASISGDRTIACGGGINGANGVVCPLRHPLAFV
jgi:hypothetical protein